MSVIRRIVFVIRPSLVQIKSLKRLYRVAIDRTWQYNVELGMK